MTLALRVCGGKKDLIDRSPAMLYNYMREKGAEE
jgi:hypothetical protein